MKAAGPKYYDAEHQALFRGRNSSRKIGWERSLDLAREASKHVVGSVLDLGCGLGFLAKFVKGPYLGMDFSPYSIRRARALGWNPTAKFVRGDIRDLPDVGQFDTVVMLEVLEHLDDPSEAIETAKRLARQRIVISVPRGQSRAGSHIWNPIGREDVMELLGPGAVCKRYRRKWLATWEHAVKGEP